MKVETTDYGFRTSLTKPYDMGVEAVTAALAEEGFGVLTEIDVRKTLKEKLGAEFRRYVILGACNPPLAHEALATDLEVGLLLPCNVVVYEDGDGCMVSIVDPLSMLGVAENADLEPVALEAQLRLRRVIEGLAA